MAEVERIVSMTPEDTNKIVAAIDRNTEATREVAVGGLVRNIILFCAFVLAFTEVCCPRAKATPLLPPLDQPVIIEIGTPPLPPPNPHVQYWHTQYVPGPQGVLPVEVFAPRLVAQVASEQVEVPEPGTRAPLGIGIGCIVGYVYFTRKAQRKAQSYRTALNDIYWSSGDDVAKQIARKALEETK